MTHKKLYSLNLVAYIYMNTKEEPILGKDPRTGSVFFLYPDNNIINFLINTYKNNNPIVNLRDLTESFRHIRAVMRSYRYGDHNDD